MTLKTTTLNRVLWTVQGLLCLIFLFAGGIKLVLPIEAMTKDMPLPGLFLRFISVAEVLGGLGLILPGTLRIRQGLTSIAAACLVIIMIGATVVTLMSGPVVLALMPLTVGALLVFVAYGRRVPPGTFRVQRTKRIQASPEKVFEYINDFRKWGAWSPYEKLDPAMKKTYSGAAAGVGAVYEWAGNRKAGMGRMEIMDVLAHSKIIIKLDFLKPFEGHNTAEFTLESKGESTDVTWAVYGPQSYLAKVMTIFVSMDSLLGKEFEEGLSNLKTIAERQNAIRETSLR